MSNKSMSKAAAARIQAAEAKANGGRVAKGGFAARAQRAADKASPITTNSSTLSQQQTSRSDKVRIQSSQAKRHDGITLKNSFPSRVQSTVDKRN